MCSTMRVVDGKLVERLRPLDLYFDLQAVDHELCMVLQKARLGMISCPSFLMPAVQAQEYATPGKLHFTVAASLPLIGLLVAYQGHLQMTDLHNIELGN